MIVSREDPGRILRISQPPSEPSPTVLAHSTGGRNAVQGWAAQGAAPARLSGKPQSAQAPRPWSSRRSAGQHMRHQHAAAEVDGISIVTRRLGL